MLSLVATLLLLCMLLPACAPARLNTDRARELAALSYPETAQRGPALDIVARTENNTLHLINREPQTHRDMQLWLNRQYVRRIGRVAIGDGNRWPLLSFVNRYREPFPIGGLLSPEDRRRVVLVELYDPEADVRYPLTAQPEED
ncbi:MAG: hypothetical protein ACODAQ_05890 [Phycisphaeraceae bacterium]